MTRVISYHETWHVSYLMHEIRQASKISATILSVYKIYLLILTVFLKGHNFWTRRARGEGAANSFEKPNTWAIEWQNSQCSEIWASLDQHLACQTTYMVSQVTFYADFHLRSNWSKIVGQMTFILKPVKLSAIVQLPLHRLKMLIFQYLISNGKQANPLLMHPLAWPILMSR